MMKKTESEKEREGKGEERSVGEGRRARGRLLLRSIAKFNNLVTTISPLALMGARQESRSCSPNMASQRSKNIVVQKPLRRLCLPQTFDNCRRM